MGQPKASIRLWDGRTMVEHVVDTLLAICPLVVVVGMDSSLHIQAGERIAHLPDREAGRGPLSGIDALLASGIDDGYIVAACDQPLLSVLLLRRLTEGDPNRPHLFRAARANSFLPLPAYLPASLLPDARRVLVSPDRSLRALVGAISPQWIEISFDEEELLMNVNTPSQLAELHRRMREEGHAD